MTIKIKLFVGFLALVALFSIFVFVNNFNKSFRLSANIPAGTGNTSNLDFAPDADPDHDGLTNKEEAYWNTDPFNPDTDGDGFKDGEEVASGHDPTKPGPNDLLNSDNLTQKLTELTLSGLYEGSLKPNSPTYPQSLADITSSIIDSATHKPEKKVSADDLTIVLTTTKNQNQYLETLSPIMQDFVITFLDELKTLQFHLEKINKSGFADSEIADYFTAKDRVFSSVESRLLSVPVPKNWESNHLALLNMVHDLSAVNHDIAGGNDDPIRAVAALNLLGDIILPFTDLVQSFEDRATTEKLTMPDFFSKLR